jgi:predicted kinase
MALANYNRLNHRKHQVTLQQHDFINFGILAHMKSLVLSRPLVIMVVGIPGAGKSFFARQFAETFSAPLVSLDTLRSIVFPEPRHDKDEEALLMDIAANEIVELLKSHKTFIVDGGVNARVDRAEIEREARKHDYNTLIVWVQTDEPTSRQRATKRNAKRKGDEYNTSIAPETFDTLSKRVVTPLRTENYVVISGKHTYATQAKIVLKKLVLPREDESQPVHPPSRNNHDQTPPTRQRSITVN